VMDQCSGAGLQGCDKFSDGILKYVDGDKEAGRAKIEEAAAENSGKKIQEFADRLNTLKQLPGAGSFLDPVDEIIAMLKSKGGAEVSAKAAGAAGCPTTTAAKGAAPPEGAVGFRFGMAQAEAESLCVGRGWTVRDQDAECLKPPVDLGLPAKARLNFGNGRVSGIVVEVNPEEGHLANTWRTLQQSLEAKYGPVAKKDTRPGVVHVEWTWPDGHSVVPESSTSAGPKPRIEIRYETPKLNASGL